jgi:hypothetical protein
MRAGLRLTGTGWPRLWHLPLLVLQDPHTQHESSVWSAPDARASPQRPAKRGKVSTRPAAGAVLVVGLPVVWAASASTRSQPEG